MHLTNGLKTNGPRHDGVSESICRLGYHLRWANLIAITFNKKPHSKSNAKKSDQIFAGIGSTPSDAAKEYWKHGFSPVPLKPKSKKPKISWKDSSFDPETDYQLFGKRNGIGLKLGPDFGGLIDVDLDCPEARQLASKFLPKTNCILGRSSASGSHWVYQSKSSLKTKKYQIKLGGIYKILLEVRGGNNLVTFPPSIHPSGEILCFMDGMAAMPRVVDPKILVKKASRMAVTILLVLSWPKTSGIRQDIAMALAGGMIRSGLKVEYTKKFIRRIAKVAGDDEADKRGQAALDTAAKIKAGNETTGWPTLAELLGTDGNEIVKKCIEWLGANSPANVSLRESETDGAKIIVLSADQIVPKKVEWFWPGLIPRGVFTIIDGEPGTGKSTITLDLAARQSAGNDLPDGEPCSPGRVIILSAEDRGDNTIVPRLMAAGGDRSQIRIVPYDMKVTDGEARGLSLQKDIAQLAGLVDELDAKLLIIDPITAFLGKGVNPNDDYRVRSVLGPIRTLAETTGITVILVRHLNKKEGLSAINRGSGSIGLIAASRSGLLVGPDPYDPDTKVLAAVKYNLTGKPLAWRYRIVSEPVKSDDGTELDTGKVEWMGDTDITADQLVAIPKTIRKVP